jgi:hypothetical protein
MNPETEINTEKPRGIQDLLVYKLWGLPSILTLFYLSVGYLGYNLLAHSQGGNYDIAVGFLLMTCFIAGASVYYMLNLTKEIRMISIEKEKETSEKEQLKIQNADLIKRVDELETKLETVIKIIENLPEKYKKYVVI